MLGDQAELLRREMGETGRREVAAWDWSSSTRHLLTQQYAAAALAAAMAYGLAYDGVGGGSVAGRGDQGGAAVPLLKTA